MKLPTIFCVERLNNLSVLANRPQRSRKKQKLVEKLKPVWMWISASHSSWISTSLIVGGVSLTLYLMSISTIRFLLTYADVC